MGLISSLNTGKTSLATQRLAMEVTGNNISNAATEGYTRQRAVIVNNFSREEQLGMFVGQGAKVQTLQRMVDKYLEVSLRNANSQANGLAVKVRTYNRVEAMVNELNDTDISTLINEYFNAFDECVNNPTAIGNRAVVLERGSALATSIRELRTAAVSETQLLDNELVDTVTRVNQISESIADLNVKIMQSERGEQFKGAASELRDERGRLLNELSGIVEIRVQEMPDGTMTVLTGSRALVMASSNFELSVEQRSTGKVTVSDVIFDQNGEPLPIKDGSMKGLIESRDEIVHGLIDDLDSLASGLIEQVNRLHSEGMGLDRYASVTSLESVSNPAAALNAASLPFTPRNGSFEIKIVNENSGEATTFDIDVDLDGLGADTTLNDVVAEINGEVGGAFPEITARVTPQNRLEIRSSGGNIAIGFGEDSSNLLAALGVNTFFTGSSGADIGVRQDIVDNPRLLAGARSTATGDNTNFRRMQAVRDSKQSALGNLTLEEHYARFVGEIAVSASTTAGASESATVHFESLQADREGVSGVNLDEEAVNLIRYQGVYAASANYLSTVRSLIDTLLNI